MTGLAALLAMHLPGSPIRAELTAEETRRVAACLLAAGEAPTDEGATP